MQYNQPYGIPDPNAPYINGNPATGTPGSIPPAASIEFPQREIVNVISDAGLAVPTNNDLHQLSKAIQSQLLQSDDDAGFANQYQVTMTPAPTAYFKYMQVICVIQNDNTGPSTLNCNALGPRPIQHYDGSNINPGELQKGRVTCFEFDGSRFQIAWSSGGVATPAQPGTPAPGPVYLSANADWYVNAATGSDTLYDGTSPTVVAGTIHGPFLTIQRACYQVGYFNLNGYNVTIHVADGNYPGFQAVKINGSGQVFIIGDTGNPDACVVTGTNSSAAMFQFIGGTYTFRGFKVQASGSSNSDPMCGVVIGGTGTNVGLGELTFGPCVAAHIAMQWSSLAWNIAPGVPWKIEAGCTGWNGSGLWNGAFLTVFEGAQWDNDAFGGPALTIANPVTYPGEFIQALSFASAGLFFTSITNPGNVTGRKFWVGSLSIISSGGGGLNYFPGNSAGLVDSSTGGYYQ